jgi:hypothetical protein
MAAIASLAIEYRILRRQLMQNLGDKDLIIRSIQYSYGDLKVPK